MRGEIIEMRRGEFHQFPIVLHGPRARAMLAGHRRVSQRVPTDRRALHLIADALVTTEQAFTFDIQ